MSRIQRGLVAAITAGVIALTGSLQGQAPESGRGHPAQDWPLVGGDWSSSRYSTLTDIATGTVDRLGGAWVTSLDGGAASRATPVVKNGVLYLTAGANVFAIDARTGETVWRWEPPGDSPQMVPSWQGVGLGDDLVFVGLRSSQVAALRQDTGELVWAESVGSVPQQSGESVTTAPMYAQGTVFVGVANGDSGGQGRIVALDAVTGEKAWTFFIVPRPGEFGHDTWPQDSDTWELGGGGVWLVGTVDPDLGMVYFSTGNPVPMFGGEIRAGDNLFTASVVALDIETGARRWHYQVVRHDVWDADIATPLMLYEHVAQVGGEPRKALAAMRADGHLFLFDRETGVPLMPIEQRPVPQDGYQRTASTQPFPVGAESILPDCSFWRDRVPPPFQLSCSGFTPPSVDQHTVVAPGVPIPRVRVTPMSYSPQTRYIYAQGIAMVGLARRPRDPWLSNAGGFQLTLPDAVGIIAAVDTRTGRVVWKQEVPTSLLGTSGPLTTAGGLMFRGAPDGLVEALDARTGARVWVFQTAPEGARMRPGPAVTYELDGQQFIAIPMGRDLWAFALDGPVPARGVPVDDPWANLPQSGPATRETSEIEAATLIENPSWSVGGRRYAVREHAFNPVRAQVTAGVRVRFLNNGEMEHTIAARDGSWTTDTLEPATWQFVTFDEPGTFLYHCTDHPWAIGEITVVP
jgi:alcohol dehydrogenase (cytochrome c)